MFSTISIAAPAYNEGSTIDALVRSWVVYLASRFEPGNYEIVVCDDGSGDETGARLEELAREFSSVRRCRHAVNEGAAAALRTAIRATTKEWVFLLDADGQYPVENLDLFRQAQALSGALAFIGYRARKEDSGFARLGSRVSGASCNWFHGTRLRDFNCALKLVRGDLLRGLNLEARGLNYSTEITSKILERGVALEEIEAVHRPRTGGRSSRTLWRGSVDRMLFVFYIGFRQGLRRWGILKPEKFSES